MLLNPLGGVELPNLGWAWPQRDREEGRSEEDGAKASAREHSDRIAAAISRGERILLSKISMRTPLPLVCVMIVVIKSVAFHSHSLEGKISFAGGILFEEEAGAVARRAHTEKAAEELPDRASRGL